MTSHSPSRITFLGCGSIAGKYAEAVARHAELRLAGVYDLDAGKRAELAAEHGCADYADLDELCADQPDVVVNLTSAPHHYASTLDLIERGQNVFSEKTLAMTHGEAQKLVARAAERNLRLACAPSLWLGAATTAAAQELRQGRIGTVRLINAEVNQGRIESWHPAPEVFYQVGPVFDAGVYPLAYLTAVFGPVRSVSASSATLLRDRRTVDGEPFTPTAADAWVATAQFESGPMLRLSANFYVDPSTGPRTIDFHGDTGSLRLQDWVKPGSGIEHAAHGEAYRTLSAGDPSAGIDWSIGLLDLVAAIREDRAHRTGAEHAAHVVEVLEAIATSAEVGARVPVHSSFPTPLPATSPN